jgi:hypothetical protein
LKDYKTIKIFGKKTNLQFFSKKDINKKYLSWLKDKKNLKYSNNKYKILIIKIYKSIFYLSIIKIIFFLRFAH